VVAPAPGRGGPRRFRVRLAAPSEVLSGSALVGQAVLYRWPMEGWVRGTVTGRSSAAAGFSHVVRYGRTSALGPGVVPSLLDEAFESHGPQAAGRWPGFRVRLLRSTVP